MCVIEKSVSITNYLILMCTEKFYIIFYPYSNPITSCGCAA
jgi:hypothetical protein